MNEITIKYFCDSLEKLKSGVTTSNQVIESLQFRKEEYLKQIENSKNEIDMAYDVFSAKPIKNQFYRDQIKNFQEQVDKIDLELEHEYCKLSDLESQIKSIEACLKELRDFEKEMDEKTIEKKIIKEKELEEQTLQMKQTEMIHIKKEDVESLIYKCENSKSFLNVDKDRSLMELDEVMKGLRKLIGTN